MPAIAKGKFFLSMSLQISRTFVTIISKAVLAGARLHCCTRYPLSDYSTFRVALPVRDIWRVLRDSVNLRWPAIARYIIGGCFSINPADGPTRDVNRPEWLWSPDIP